MSGNNVSSSLTDEEMEHALRCWADRARAATQEGSTPTWVERPASSSKTIAVIGSMSAAILLTIVLIWLRSVSGGSQSKVSTGDSVVPSGQLSNAVVHDGDEARAFGKIILDRDGTATFCPNLPVFKSLDSPDDSGDRCSVSINLKKAKDNVAAKRVLADGTIVGYAEIRGIYSDGTLTVEDQVPHPLDHQTDFQNPPCSAPSGGWPQTAEVDVQAAVAYERMNPSIQMYALLHPSDSQAVMYLVTEGSAADVISDLSGAYPDDLCVAQAKYSSGELTAATEAVRNIYENDDPGSIYSVTGEGGPILNDELTPTVFASVPMLSADVARRLDKLPAGVLSVSVWLVPTH